MVNELLSRVMSIGMEIIDKKKILIICRSFYPLNNPRSFRSTELVKEFARRGHNVKVLTFRRDEMHEEFMKKHDAEIRYTAPLTFSEFQFGTNINLFKTISRKINRALGLLFEYPDIEIAHILKKTLKNESDYDLLITIAVPHPIHWGTAWARKQTNFIARTWVADCGDPYMGATLDTFRKPFYFKYAERAFCERADYITVPFEGAKDGYYPEFRDKIKVIPQGFNFNDVNIQPGDYSPCKVPTFAYAGELIPGGRDPRKFLDYLILQEKVFKFYFYTKKTSLLEPYLEKSNGRIEIRNYIPRKQLLQELSKMDFLVNIENSTSLQRPSKLIDYYLTGRPVLSIESGKINPDHIDEFLKGKYERQYQYDNISQFRIENVCNEFLKLCE